MSDNEQVTVTTDDLLIKRLRARMNPGDCEAAAFRLEELLARVDALEDQLSALAKQDPEPELVQHRKPLDDFDGSAAGLSEWKNGAGLSWWPHRKLYARPVPAEPVNARLVEALKAMLDGVDCSDYGEEGIDCPSPVTHKAGSACPVCNARDAVAAAEAQQDEPNTAPADMVNRAFQDGINSGYAQAMMDEMARHRQAEPELVEGAPCRNALWRDGKPFPKSSCQRCGTLLRPGWKCADGVEV